MVGGWSQRYQFVNNWRERCSVRTHHPRLACPGWAPAPGQRRKLFPSRTAFPSAVPSVTAMVWTAHRRHGPILRPSPARPECAPKTHPQCCRLLPGLVKFSQKMCIFAKILLDICLPGIIIIDFNGKSWHGTVPQTSRPANPRHRPRRPDRHPEAFSSE